MGFQHEVETPNSTGTVSLNRDDAVAARGGSLTTDGFTSETFNLFTIDSVRSGHGVNVSLDLSRTSAIYNGAKVQAPALQALPCIKT